ncbi:hypothetical protein [Vibrio coralliilyticus]|uniref:hypothetical protein n=1 Tax=Vibrio coralliilyticus TaxID=190893 RepID=UPI0003784F6F|nr:hypothetical protein [Vibrio coralliilyticus]
MKAWLAGILMSVAWHAGAQCYPSTVQSPTPFMGRSGEVFQLADGTLWEIRQAYEYLYHYAPRVEVCPNLGSLTVSGKTLPITALGRVALHRDPLGPDEILHSAIAGQFNGFEGDTLFKLANGQVWKQQEYAYWYHYAYAPSVRIERVNGQYRMTVNGVAKSISVLRLK